MIADLEVGEHHAMAFQPMHVQFDVYAIAHPVEKPGWRLENNGMVVVVVVRRHIHVHLAHCHHNKNHYYLAHLGCTEPGSLDFGHNKIGSQFASVQFDTNLLLNIQR